MFKNIQKNKGAALTILLLFFIVVSLTILVGLVSPVVREFKISSDSLVSRQSYFNAESGMEDLMYRIKSGKEVGETGEDRVILINDNYFPIPVTITDGLNNRKNITMTSDYKSRERSLSVSLTTSTGVSFNYGVLVGQGGIYLNSGTINGNVYANGPISGSHSGSNIITGSAISANSPSLLTNQANGSGVPSYNISFGNASGTQDVAQSFQVTESSPLNKVQLYIKKYGTPSDAVVKIVSNNSGSPSTNVLATGTLVASSVTTSYGWVTVTFSENPTLDTGTTYWIVVDGGTSSKKYYIIGASNGGYDNGLGKIGQYASSWNNTTPSGLDYYFNISLGGVNGSINGFGPYNQIKIGTTSGTAWANTVNNSNVTGDIYCQNGSGNNKSCIGRPDPAYIEYPVSDANIEEWKADASSGGTYIGNYVVDWDGDSFGPRKIQGNLTINGGGDLVMTGNIWVTGNLVLEGGGLIKLDPSYGENDAVIVVDGTITVSGGGHATGSGTDGSYIMLLTTSYSTSAASIDGGAGAVIMYAKNGTLNISGGASLKEATGYKINISGNASITYESGLTNNNFSSGPSGTWSVDSWGESD
jgi:hypothetical protein